jgi:amidophosphoribosyltransferase
MAKLEGLVAFRALELLKERNLYHIVEEVYLKCKAQENYKDHDILNYVTAIYEPFQQEVSDKIGDVVLRRLKEVKIIFQTVEDLHTACPKNLGIGTYRRLPTPGGNRVVNKAFMNFY